MFLSKFNWLQVASLALALFVTVTSLNRAPGEESAAEPNIVIVLADDLGYGDLGCYGNPIIKTPHLDRLAGEGVRLLDCHSGGTVCSPSRAALLTGRNPYRIGFYSIAGAHGAHLRHEEVTVASLLKKKGYDTCFVGKWHLGGFGTSNGKPSGPDGHGFDHWFATSHNAFDGPENPGKFFRNGKKVGPTKGWYCDLIVEESIEWLKKRPDQKKPFFLLVCLHEPHTPVRPPESYSAMYDNPEVDRLETTINYGQVHRPLNHDISENKKYYYGTVTQMDNAVGKLIKDIDQSYSKKNTVIFFTSDNGPETPVTVEESHNEWTDKIRNRCFGSTGPWRGMKRFVFEGGHRVPGIMRWTGKVKPGLISDQLVNGTDVLPTICEIVGIEKPGDRVIDGVSLLPLLNGDQVTRDIPACWMFPVGYDYMYLENMAMRDGNYLMMGCFEKPAKDQKHLPWIKSTKLADFQLYDLGLDVSQRYDLSKVRPEVYAKMKKRMTKLWQEIQAEGPDWQKLK